MSESKSTSISLDVYSARMRKCRNVYPCRIVRPLGKHKVDTKKQLSHFIQDILANDGKIEMYVADNLKRATGKDCLCHSSLYPCEYCFSRGVRHEVPSTNLKAKKQFKRIRQQLTSVSNEQGKNAFSKIEQQINEAEKQLSNKKRSRIVWPASTSNGEPRTTEKIIRIVEKIEDNGGRIPPEEAKGVCGRSPLLSIPNFDMVRDSPTEYLHSVCLGVSKKLVELTFQVGETRQINMKRKPCNPAKYNERMSKIKVPKQSSRRVRELDFAVLKGQEFRNITIFFFPVIVECVENKPERVLWLKLAFIIRACVLPTNEFKNHLIEKITKLSDEFYVLYERLYGPQNCTYNTHVVLSHLIEMRAHGPLTYSSAFGFESFYGEIRNSFKTGTQSPLIQIFKKILFKRALSHHCCEATINYSAKETALQNDTLIYVYKDDKHLMYKIHEVKENSLMCYRQGKYKHAFSDVSNIEWSDVGVYKKGPISDESVEIMKKNVAGKLLLVENLLITCPNNVLREK